MFSIFCGALSQCNAALNVLMKTRGDHSNHHHIVESSSKNLDHRSSSSSGEDKSPAPHQDRNITEMILLHPHYGKNPRNMSY